MSRIAVLVVVACALMGLATIPAAAQSDAQPPDSHFDKVVLDQTPGEPMDLAILPDGRVLHVTRQGHVWLHDQDTGLKTLANKLDVYLHDEEGLQNIALDPNFEENGWVYLYYSPPLDTPADDPTTPGVNEGDAPFFGDEEDWERFEGHLQLSRFQWTGDSLDLDSEQQILQVPVDRGICCHVGGDIVFDAEGNLYLSTGDDTNPFESSGYTPIDEREGRNPAFDAQRTSANTNDLRGKILRITVQEDGSYTIPEGNMFEPGTEGTLPEIYLMGLRNPFRIEYNQVEGELYVGDYSPDARTADPERGPGGIGKWFVATEPGNYGWPYCATAEHPYVDYDFATGESGEEFDCDDPVNESPHNTGLVDLPTVTMPTVWYPFQQSEEFPELGSGGIAPMAGPAYQIDPRHARNPSFRNTAWPAYFDNVPLFYEWSRDFVREFHLDGDRDEIADIRGVLDAFELVHPIDIEFGPDGSLYVLNYGQGFFGQNQPGAELARIDYIGEPRRGRTGRSPYGNRSPSVTISTDDETVGAAPLTVSFSTDAEDPEGQRLRYAWDFDADGTIDSREANPTHTFTENGVFNATLQVRDLYGRTTSDYITISVGNTAPTIRFVTPQEGDEFSFGDTVEYEIAVEDDTEVNCDNVSVTYSLGHNDHAHGISTTFGCSGSITTTLAGGHDPETDDLYGVFTASYTDEPGEGLPPLSASTTITLEPTD